MNPMLLVYLPSDKKGYHFLCSTYHGPKEDDETTHEIFEKAQELRKERTDVELGEDGTARRKAKKYTSPKIDSGEE